MPSNGKPMDVTLTIVSLIIWTLSLLILAVVMLRKIKGVGIEEIELVVVMLRKIKGVGIEEIELV